VKKLKNFLKKMWWKKKSSFAVCMNRGCGMVHPTSRMTYTVIDALGERAEGFICGHCKKKFDTGQIKFWGSE
jgi:hypothetical protein